MSLVNTAQLTTLGGFIRARRHALGLTQVQLAERTGWVQERISLLEHGKYGLPSLPALARLADALEVPLEDVLVAAGYPPISGDGADAGGPTATAHLHTLEELLCIDALELRVAMNQVSDLLVRAMGADKADVFLLEPGSETLVALGSSDTPMAQLQRALGLDRLDLSGHPLAVEAFLERDLFRTGDAAQDPAVPRPLVTELGIRSMVSVRLRWDERQGALQAHSAQPHRFADDDVRLFRSAARWVSVIGHRAELAAAVR